MLAMTTNNESKGSEYQTGLQKTDTHSSPPPHSPAPIPSEFLPGPAQSSSCCGLASFEWTPAYMEL